MNEVRHNPVHEGRVDDLPPAKREESIGTLLGNFADETRNLLRQEVALAKTETAEKLSKARNKIVEVAAGGAVLVAAAVILFTAVNRAVTALFLLFVDELVAIWLAPLVLTVVLGIVGFVLISRGMKSLKGMSVMPEKTKQTLRDNTQWVKEKMGHA